MIGVVIATHCTVASALAQATEVVLGHQVALACVDLPPEATREDAWKALSSAVDQTDAGDGVLVLVDMLGGTPSNLAMALLAEGRVDVVTGVNLPMVLRAIGRRQETTDLTILAQDVLEYGRRNVTAATQWLQPAGPEAA
ncbi:MAG: PTS sugar transporter subunit IIA [Oligoflexia bacterium]|nr:PTS sugar transporter subunit IIA [Oligoflexia bacterium]